MTVALIPFRDGTVGKVDVYRNGDTVTIRHAVAHRTPAGTIQQMAETQMPLAVFDYLRTQAIARLGSLAYTRIIGRIGIDDDARRAPPLPNFRPLGLPTPTAVARPLLSARTPFRP